MAIRFLNITDQLPTKSALFGESSIEVWSSLKHVKSSQEAFELAHIEVSEGHVNRAIEEWFKIALNPNHYIMDRLQAWYFLRAHGKYPPEILGKEVLGLVVELGIPKGGEDIMVVYSDYSIQYFNHSGSGIAWEPTDTSLNSTVDDLIIAGSQIVMQIGPGDWNRLPPIERGGVRFYFLTPSGVHFGTGRLIDVGKDQSADCIMRKSTVLLEKLLRKRAQN